jgi:hypothetical protein
MRVNADPFLKPMFRREALWISLDSKIKKPAVKVSTSGEIPE